MNTESVLPTKPTKQLHNKSSIDNSGSSSNQFVDNDDSHNVESCPHSLSSDNDVFTTAFNVLEQIARENGFAIHEVPYD
jgi:hypothetical protein